MERTKLSRFTSMLLAVIMILSSFTALSVTSTEASAEEKPKYHVDEYNSGIYWAKVVTFEEPYKHEMRSYGPTQQRHLLRVRETGKVAYCIQPGLFLHNLSSGDAEPLDEDISAAWNALPDNVKKSLKYPLYFGYSNDGYPNENTDLVGSEYKLTGTAAEKEVATQLIVWELVCGYRDPETFELLDARFADGMFGTSRDHNTGVLANYNKIVAATIRFRKILSFSNRKSTLAVGWYRIWNMLSWTARHEALISALKLIFTAL